MYQFGHFGVALLAYTPVGVGVAMAGYEPYAIGGALVCVALSTLPDADDHLPGVDHRGPTHTVAFALAVGATLALVTVGVTQATTVAVESWLPGFAFVVGSLSILSHLAADAITPMGIRPFWPLSRRHYTADITPAKNRVANYLLLGLGVAATVAGAFVVTQLG